VTAFGPSLPRRATLARGIRRLLAPNASMMTGPGTNTYLFGEDAVAVVDPGPHLEEHLEAIVNEASGPIRWILATHTHPDHSPGVAALAERTGAEVLGRPAPRGSRQDSSFSPSRILDDGDVLETDEFRLEAIHTPGHASNHLCFLHGESNWMVTGDHVIDGSTVVINPPDGNMTDYLASLVKVRDRRPAALLPGHGDRIDDPTRVIDWIIDHRLEREAQVLDAVREHPGSTTRALVSVVYREVPGHLHRLAERSLLAHLEKLEAERRVVGARGAWRAT
jgi:glyoxylase-like metal-dependent hydrolase (beta-lactamase superfamily II)